MTGYVGALAAGVVVLGLTASHALHAQTYPTRPVTIIVPTTAGGGTDIIARIIGDQLARQLGQAFVIENRPGAGLLVGTAAAANAAPDGYTLLAGLNDHGLLNRDRLAKLDIAVLKILLDRAVAAAAITCSRAGANPPTKRELEDSLGPA